MSLSLEDRFWNYVDLQGPDECWGWKACHNVAGYGRFGVRINNKPKMELAHRMSYKLNKGSIPDGMYVCHTCDNPGCVNPNHLWLGTDGDNTRDMTAKGRRYSPDVTGSANPNSKLTNDQILSMRADKRETAHIAKDFGVSGAHVRRIKTSTSWSHLTVGK